jgi:hypothetical protein
MEEARRCANDVVEAVCDGLKKIGDFSYAIMPKDIAHAVGDLNKAILNQIRGCVDWEIGWTDDRVAGGDRMREEWREKCRRQSTVDTTSAPGV